MYIFIWKWKILIKFAKDIINQYLKISNAPTLYRRPCIDAYRKFNFKLSKHFMFVPVSSIYKINIWTRFLLYLQFFIYLHKRFCKVSKITMLIISILSHITHVEINQWKHCKQKNYIAHLRIGNARNGFIKVIKLYTAYKATQYFTGKKYIGNVRA